MNKTHKGHFIYVSASRSASTQWKSRLKITWSEDGEGKVSKLTGNRGFRQRQEAEVQALNFAKKWIDAGKPDSSLNFGSEYGVDSSAPGRFAADHDPSEPVTTR